MKCTQASGLRRWRGGTSFLSFLGPPIGNKNTRDDAPTILFLSGRVSPICQRSKPSLVGKWMKRIRLFGRNVGSQTLN